MTLELTAIFNQPWSPIVGQYGATSMGDETDQIRPRLPSIEPNGLKYMASVDRTFYGVLSWRFVAASCAERRRVKAPLNGLKSISGQNVDRKVLWPVIEMHENRTALDLVDVLWPEKEADRRVMMAANGQCSAPYSIDHHVLMTITYSITLPHWLSILPLSITAKSRFLLQPNNVINSELNIMLTIYTGSLW